MGMMVGRGQKAPFNYLLSSLHQIELLLDPDNGDIRIGEVEQLYQHGRFEAALRLAQAGNSSPATRSALYSQAAQAALQTAITNVGRVVAAGQAPTGAVVKELFKATGEMVVSQVQLVEGITRTLTCPVVNL